MSETVRLTIDGGELRVPAGTSVAAALAVAGIDSFRTSVLGAPRGPLCGMGICFECRVEVDGVAHVRACMRACCDGMEVRTHA